MKRIIVVALLLPLAAVAQRVDTTTTDPDKYVPELGYFQKAHTDASDPRFMITDDEGRFSMGVGGVVHCNTFYDVGGSMDGYLFSPGTIQIPVDNTSHFGYTATGSNVYVKARAIKGNNKVTAYLSLQGSEMDGADYVMLSKAYISLNGLTIGKTYSYFMDLEAGPMTVDLEGPNTQISKVHSLIGYTQPMGRWTLAAALEAPNTISTSWQSNGVSSDYNKYPDLAARLKYRGEKGHIQAGLLLREVSYWASKTGFGVAADGITKYVTGYGFSLSGNYNPTGKLSFSAQGIWGNDVSHYIQDLAPLELGLGMESVPDAEGYPTLAALTAYGGYLSASYKWSEVLRSAVVYGFCQLDDNGLMASNPFRRSEYVAANLFVFFSPYCFFGIEYLYGHKLINAVGGADNSGYANRINASIAYRF